MGKGRKGTEVTNQLISANSSNVYLFQLKQPWHLVFQGQKHLEFLRLHVMKALLL